MNSAQRPAALRDVLHHTRRAMVEYRRTAPARAALWDNAFTPADIDQAMLADQIALAAVREAFFLDTAEFNSYDHAMLIDIATLERWGT